MVLIPLLTLNLLFTHRGRHVQVRKLVAHCCRCVLVALVKLNCAAVLMSRGEALLSTVQFVVTSVLVRKHLSLLRQGAMLSQRDTSLYFNLGLNVTGSCAW